VGDALEGYDSQLRHAATMTASELVENAVKYGEDVAAAPNIVFSFCFDGDQMQIVVSNGGTDLNGKRKLQDRVQQIADAPDKGALYMARLEELLADQTESGELGLYRVAFEGGFELRVTCTDDVVSVIATRPCR
jgi:hypothetical protein